MGLTNRQHPTTTITQEEYLAGELISEVKHEYIAGGVYAMAGASKNHQRIVTNLSGILYIHLQNAPCEVFTSDLKLKVKNNFFYPDILVVCDDKPNNDYYTESPLIIVEVLSKSTRKIDQTLKRRAYQNLASLNEYVLIQQDFVDIEICQRSNYWQSNHYFLGDEVYFSAIDLHIPVESIYSRVVNEDMREFLENLEVIRGQGGRETSSLPAPTGEAL